VVFRAFDDIAAQHGCERLTSSGAFYFAVCGLSQLEEQHALLMAAAGVDIMHYLSRHNQNKAKAINIRLGFGSGALSAGIIGSAKFRFEVFGKVVEDAERLCKSSVSQGICIGPETQALVKTKYHCVERRSQKGQRLYFLKYRDDLKGSSVLELVRELERAREAFESHRFQPAAEILEDIDVSIAEPELFHKVLKLQGNVYYKMGRRNRAEAAWQQALSDGSQDKVIVQNLAVIRDIKSRGPKKNSVS